MKLLLACLTLAAMASLARSKVVMCYFESWANERTGNGYFNVETIDPFLCTHVMYAFAVLDPDTNTIASMTPEFDLPGGDNGEGAFRKFTNLKQVNPDLITILSVGGWGDGSMKYSQMASNPDTRRSFIDSSVAMLMEYGFDGLDLDWEYPGGRPGEEEGLPNDKQNHASLLREMRAEFDNHGFLLTAAVAAGQTVIDGGYDIPAMAETLDFINLMTYDFHGWWGGHDFTGHNSPLGATPEEADPDHPGHNANTRWTVDYWLSGGARRDQLLVGFGAYGRGFVLESEGRNGLYDPAVDAIEPERYTDEAGYWGFMEFCERLHVDGELDMWTVVRDPNVVSPYAYKGTDWLGYDDVTSIRAKSEFVVDMNLGGAMIWSMDTDDFNGLCGQGRFPLITAMDEVLNGGK